VLAVIVASVGRVTLLTLCIHYYYRKHKLKLTPTFVRLVKWRVTLFCVCVCCVENVSKFMANRKRKCNNVIHDDDVYSVAEI
jgi:hypothetical protein